METVEKILMLILDFVIFVVLSILFLPAFLIVTYVQPIWQKKLQSLFDL